jgi:hypothetical protein
MGDVGVKWVAVVWVGGRVGGCVVVGSMGAWALGVSEAVDR